MPGHATLQALNAPYESAHGGKIHDAGVTVPTDGTAGYAPGCIFQDLNASVGSQFYINEGSATSCDFNAIVTVAGTETITGGKTMSGSNTLSGTTTNSGTLDTTGTLSVDRTGRFVEDDYDPATRVYFRSEFAGRAYSVAVASDWSNFKSVASANMDWIVSKSATGATARASSDGGMILSGSNSSALVFIKPRTGSRLNKIKWNTSRSPRFRVVMKTGASIADSRLLIGLESAAVPKYLRNSTPDSNRVEVYLHQNADSRFHGRIGKGGSSSSATFAGVIAADTVYDIDIRVNSSRIVTVYVNRTLVWTATTALAASKALIPIIGHQSEGGKRAMAVYYCELSQDMG